jgi:hypothetical protein
MIPLLLKQPEQPGKHKRKLTEVQEAHNIEVEKKRQRSERKLLEEQKYKELKAIAEKAKVDGNQKV